MDLSSVTTHNTDFRLVRFLEGFLTVSWLRVEFRDFKKGTGDHQMIIYKRQPYPDLLSHGESEAVNQSVFESFEKRYKSCNAIL